MIPHDFLDSRRNPEGCVGMGEGGQTQEGAHTSPYARPNKKGKEMKSAFRLVQLPGVNTHKEIQLR